jgi:ribosomal protein S18 acetylase RimI-like enzyme
VRDRVSIRAATDEDVRRFVDDRDDRHFFLDHLGEKHGLLLFAFHSDNMVGHIFLRLEPAEEPELREGLPGVPLLERLKVRDPHRRLGIGQLLIAEAEGALWEMGHRQVALGVHPDNRHAIRLYERLSFTVWREQTLTTFREHVRDDGTRIREEDPCLVFVKQLDQPPD